MNSKLLTKLVFSGLKKNKKTMVPFLIAGTVVVMVYYILASLAFGPYIYHDHKEVFYGAQSIAILLESGSQIIVIFSFIFLLYANQFVMKDRRREIGIYGILGLSKWNIAAMLFEETIIKMIVCLGGGIAIGTFLNKIMLLVLYKIVEQSPVEGLWISQMAIRNTLVIFGILFGITLIYNIFSVNVGNPIELIRSNKQGEKEPKVKKLTFAFGLATMAFGYYMAFSCKTSSEAITRIFECIFLVIIGTYCLFTAGSIFILKVLKNNKNFYYKTRNFISVSNLMYRMKHNAAGLASICVLSTGVILLVTCATTLMTLGKQNIDQFYPKEVMISSSSEDVNYDKFFTELMETAAKEANISAKKEVVYSCKETLWESTADGYKFVDNVGFYDADVQAVIYILTEEDYEKYTGKHIELNDGEVLYADTNNNEIETLVVEENKYKIVGKTDIAAVSELTESEMALFNNAYIVVKDVKAQNSIVANDTYADPEGQTSIIAGFDVKETLSDEQMDKIKNVIEAGAPYAKISFKQEDKALFVTMYGGVFFVGIFLAVIFLLATVMIMYYKQMSEGFEDQNRYQILKNVGLSEEEVKLTIKRQVMILFFLPVITAIIHMAVASKIIRLFLRMVLIVDALTFNMSILVVALVFLAVYAIVYKITSLEYYKIVNSRA